MSDDARLQALLGQWKEINSLINKLDTETWVVFTILGPLYGIIIKSFNGDLTFSSILSQKPSGRLAAHIVWPDEPTEKEQARRLKELNEMMEEYLPEELCMAAYAVHKDMLPYSPTTLKKDKNKMARQTEGFIQEKDGRIVGVEMK